MRRTALGLLATAVLLPSAAGGSASTSEEPRNRARRLVESALKRLGGAERLRRLPVIGVVSRGVEHRSAEVQGHRPDQETSAQHEEVLVASPDQPRLVYEHKTGRHDGTLRWRRWIYREDEVRIADVVAKFSAARRSSSAQASRRRLRRRIPHLLLLEAIDQPERLRWSRTEDVGGTPQEVVTMEVPEDRVTFVLYLDRATNRLARFDYAMDFPALGETLVSFVYGAESKHPELGWFPAGESILVGGSPFREVRYETVTSDPREVEQYFDLPPGVPPIASPPAPTTTAAAPSRPALREIAPGVRLVDSIGGNYPLLIEFRDFLMVLEAPARHPSLEQVPGGNQEESSRLSEELIALVHEAVPGKPIRYLALTHFHSDHSGGALAFVPEGATVLGDGSSRKVIEKLVRSAARTAPDRPAHSPSLSFETVQRSKRISDGDQTVELINVGSNPHSAENLIVYFPKHKLLYQGDLFYWEGPTALVAERTTILKFFVRWLKTSGLDVEKIIGFHSEGVATKEHLRQVEDAAVKAGS